MSEYHDTETGEVLPSSTAPDMRAQHGGLLASSETAEVWSALIDAQSKIEPPQRTKEAAVRGQTAAGREYEYKYRYAPLDEILSKSRKPLGEAGLGFQQFLASRGTQSVVRTVIFHRSGQWTAIDYPIFYDQKKGAQGFASGVTYARRMGLTLALGLAPEDDDDANVADAQAASVAPAPTTKGATRTAQPRPPTSAHAIALSAASTAPSHTPSSTNGNGVPKWIGDFLARESYEIDPQKAGGWSAWEKHYLAVATATETFEQYAKLEDDNKEHAKAFEKEIKPEVYADFRKRCEAISAKYFASQADAETILQTTG